MLAKTAFILLAGALSTDQARSVPPAPPACQVNPSGQVLELKSPARFTQAFVNYGTLRTTDTTVSFAGRYTEMGTYISDPSTNYFSDLLIGPAGSLSGGPGDRFVVSGNFLNSSVQHAIWNTRKAELAFSSGPAHAVSIAGADAGPVLGGFLNNFAWGILRLASGQTLTLSDGNALPGGAIYTRKLILEGGLAQMSAITGNGFQIYYNPYENDNAYLNGQTYPLSGGGSVAPVTAVLDITSISTLPGGHILICGTGVPDFSHTVRFSSDPGSGFAPLATLIAAGDGTFQFEDNSVFQIPRRFYQITIP